MGRAAYALAVWWCCCCLGRGARGWTIEKLVPVCASRRVCDPDAILSDVDREMVENKVRKVERAAHVEVAVVLARSTGGADAEAFARGLHDRLGVGDATRHSGALLLVALDTRETYLSTGSGLRRTFLSDRRAGRVLDAIAPWLRAEDYAGAAGVALEELRRYAAGSPPTLGERFRDSLPTILFFTFFSAVVAVMVGDSRRRRRTEAARRGGLKKHLRAVEALRENHEDDICSICLEPLFLPSQSQEEEQVLSRKKLSSREEENDPFNSRARQRLVVDAPAVETIATCGHAFHGDCLRKWFDAMKDEATPTCPVCRQHVDGGSPAPDSAVVSRYAASGGATGGSMASVEPVLRFRLDRIRERYPRYVTPRHLESWRARSYAGPLADDPSNPIEIPRRPSSSSSSSRSSFGGGRSSGGAGRRF